MMGKGEARYTLTPVPSLAEHSKSLPEQSHLRANCPRDGLATGSTRRLRRFHVSALHRRSVHYCVRNALGRAIVKLIDATEGLTELTYKHFN